MLFRIAEFPCRGTAKNISNKSLLPSTSTSINLCTNNLREPFIRQRFNGHSIDEFFDSCCQQQNGKELIVSSILIYWQLWWSRNCRTRDTTKTSKLTVFLQGSVFSHHRTSCRIALAPGKSFWRPSLIWITIEPIWHWIHSPWFRSTRFLLECSRALHWESECSNVQYSEA